MRKYIYWDERWPVFMLEDGVPATMFRTMEPVTFTEEELAEGERAASAYADWQDKLRAKAKYDG